MKKKKESTTKLTFTLNNRVNNLNKIKKNLLNTEKAERRKKMGLIR